MKSDFRGDRLPFQLSFLGCIFLSLFVLVTARPAFADGGGEFVNEQMSCADFGAAAQKLLQVIRDDGFASMSQPLYVGGPISGLTESQAQRLSENKIYQYKSLLASVQDLLNQNSGLSYGCKAWTDTKQTWDVGMKQLNSLEAFNGPYKEAQVEIPGRDASVKNGYQLNLPCRADGSSPNGLRECSAVIKDVNRWAHDYLKKAIDGIYHGCDLGDPQLIQDPGQCHPKIPTCNDFSSFTDSANSIANTQAESNDNHISQSCGAWTQFRTWVSGNNCMIQNADPSAQAGTREQAYFQGNMVHSLDCHWAQIHNEIEKGYVLLTAAVGDDPKTLYHDQIQMIQDGMSSLIAHKNLSHIEDCDPNNPKGDGSEAYISACQEYTHRLVLEQHVARMAVLEVINRAKRSFERFNAGTNNADFWADFKLFLQQNAGSSACTGHRSDCNPQTYFQRCYKPNWDRFFNDRTNSFWNSGVCQ